VSSKALKGIDATSKDFDKMSKLYDEIEAETKAMALISIVDAKNESEYVAELDKVKNHLESDKWLAGVKAEAKVTTFKDLKDAYAVEEPV